MYPIVTGAAHAAGHTGGGSGDTAPAPAPLPARRTPRVEDDEVSSLESRWPPNGRRRAKARDHAGAAARSVRFMMQQRAEFERERNALEALMMEQRKHDDELLKESDPSPKSLPCRGPGMHVIWRFAWHGPLAQLVRAHA